MKLLLAFLTLLCFQVQAQTVTYAQLKAAFGKGTEPKASQLVDQWMLIGEADMKDLGGWYNPEGKKFKDSYQLYYVPKITVEKGFDGSDQLIMVIQNACKLTGQRPVHQPAVVGLQTSGSFRYKEAVALYQCRFSQGVYYENNCRLMSGNADRMICQSIARVKDANIDAPPGYDDSWIDWFIKNNGKDTNYFILNRVKF